VNVVVPVALAAGVKVIWFPLTAPSVPSAGFARPVTVEYSIGAGWLSGSLPLRVMVPAPESSATVWLTGFARGRALTRSRPLVIVSCRRFRSPASSAPLSVMRACTVLSPTVEVSTGRASAPVTVLRLGWVTFPPVFVGTV
jgi:hypothetical protein